MATKLNKISAYLTERQFKQLEALATQYGISKSQVVIMALSQLAGNAIEPIVSGVKPQDVELSVELKVAPLKALLEELSAKVEALEMELQEVKSNA